MAKNSLKVNIDLQSPYKKALDEATSLDSESSLSSSKTSLKSFKIIADHI